MLTTKEQHKYTSISTDQPTYANDLHIPLQICTSNDSAKNYYQIKTSRRSGSSNSDFTACLHYFTSTTKMFKQT